ncbi:MAG: hypothetical protein K0Q57_372 [Gammaproteobacteria bacterium]|jgi:hypothetical protein|nr:hypothetical protein [Gammaproteobacteria bacterium]
MNKFKLSALAASLLLIGVSAQADVTAQNGYYIGINAGQGTMMAPAMSLTNNWIANFNNYDTTTSAYGAYVGYHWAVSQNAMWGAEVGYSQNGSATYAGTGLTGDTGSLTYNSSSVNFLGTFTYVGSYGINGYGKLGVAYVTQNADVAGPVYINGTQQSSSNTSSSQAEPMIVLGIGYMPNQHFNIFLEGDFINGDMRPSDWLFVNTNQYNSNIYATASARIGVNYMF